MKLIRNRRASCGSCLAAAGVKGRIHSSCLTWVAQAGSWTLLLNVSRCAKHFIPSLHPRKSIILPHFLEAVSVGKQGAGEQRGPGAWASVSQEIGSNLRAVTVSSAFLAGDSWQLWKTEGEREAWCEKKGSWNCKNTVMMVLLVEFQFQIYMWWIKTWNGV